MNMKKQIKVGLLGGLDEVGKVCLVIELNEEIFLFDAGIKKLIEVDLGINYLIPDFKYLFKNKTRIQGMFLSSASSNWMGAVQFLVRKLPHLPLFASKLTCQILQSQTNLSQQVKSNLQILNEQNNQFKTCRVERFAISGDMPGNSGYLLRFNQQQIVYAPTFLLNNDGMFPTKLDKLFNDKFQTLLLIANAQQGEHTGFTKPKNDLQPWLEEGLSQHNKQIYLACFDDQWAKIYETLQFLTKYKETFQIVFFDHEFGDWYRKNLGFYHQQEMLNFRTDQTNQHRKIIIITGNEKWLFSRIRLLINNQTHPYALKAESYFMLLANRKDQINEIEIYNLLNNLAGSEAKIQFLNQKKVLPMVGGTEDLKFLVQLVKPRYFLPINGYHQDLKKIGQKLAPFFRAEQILYRENGQITSFDSQKLTVIPKSDFLELESIFVETNDEKFLRSSAIQQRKKLGETGILLASFYYQVRGLKVNLISPLLTKYVGIAVNEDKKNKINNAINTIINQRLQKEQKHEIKSLIFEEKLKREIMKILKQELKTVPLIGLKIIEKV